MDTIDTIMSADYEISGKGINENVIANIQP